MNRSAAANIDPAASPSRLNNSVTPPSLLTTKHLAWHDMTWQIHKWKVTTNRSILWVNLGLTNHWLRYLNEMHGLKSMVHLLHGQLCKTGNMINLVRFQTAFKGTMLWHLCVFYVPRHYILLQPSSAAEKQHLEWWVHRTKKMTSMFFPFLVQWRELQYIWRRIKFDMLG